MHSYMYPHREYPQGICSHAFVVDDFSKLFLHSTILLIKDSRLA